MYKKLKTCNILIKILLNFKDTWRRKDYCFLEFFLFLILPFLKFLDKQEIHIQFRYNLSDFFLLITKKNWNMEKHLIN